MEQSIDEFLARMSRVADQFEAEAQAIESAQLGGRASDLVGDIVVDSNGVVTHVRLAERAMRMAQTDMSHKLWELYEDAAADALRANVATLPPDLAAGVVESVPADVAQRALRDEADGRIAGVAPEPVQPATATRPGEAWDPGSAPGVDPTADPQIVMQQLRAMIDHAVERQQRSLPALRSVVGEGAAPPMRPNVRATVNALGVPTSISIVNVGTDLQASELSAQVMAALAAAKEDAAEQVALVEREFGGEER